jgi:elongation factor P--beta-lysine ligase
MKKSLALLPIRIRGEVIKAIRAFFEEEGFQEVITPTLNRALPLEPTLHAFETTWQPGTGDQALYLSISPESGLKKMLAQGMGDCYAISKCFRNLEGNGTRHNPEFLMLEWYREQATYHQIMQDSQALVKFVKDWVDTYLKKPLSPLLQYGEVELDLNQPWPSVSLAELVEAKVEVTLESLVDDRTLKQTMEDRGYQTSQASWEQLFNQLMLNEIEGDFPTQPFFLTDFPARLSPLCRLQADKPYLAERFELYIAGMEVGNGNTENTDARAIETAFETEEQTRAMTGQLSPPIDHEFIKAIAALKSHSYAGIGLGVDRLAMIMANVTDISEVEPFVL